MKIAHSTADKKLTGSSGFKSARWIILGCGSVMVANLCHVCVFPFADMTLFASTSSIAIMMSVFLSIVMLGEKFIWAYDLPAALLICSCSGLTVMQMNHEINIVYSRDHVIDLLFSFNALCLGVATFFFTSTLTAVILNLRSKV
jgi:hypothetical protein